MGWFLQADSAVLALVAGQGTYDKGCGRDVLIQWNLPVFRPVGAETVNCK